MLLKLTQKIIQENAFEQKKPGLSQIPSSPFSAYELGTSHNGLLRNASHEFFRNGKSKDQNCSGYLFDIHSTLRIRGNLWKG